MDKVGTGVQLFRRARRNLKVGLINRVETEWKDGLISRIATCLRLFRRARRNLNEGLVNRVETCIELLRIYFIGKKEIYKVRDSECRQT